MTTTTDPADSHLQAELVRHLEQGDLDYVEVVAEPGPKLRIDVVQAGQLFYWITFIATTDAEFDQAAGGRAAMRSFPWSEPFRPKLERSQATLPVLCRWQRAYVEDTASFCATLLVKHFQMPSGQVQVLGRSGSGGQPDGGKPPAQGAKQQKVWLREITAWYMRSRG